MIGSFTHPPIIIKKSKPKMALRAATSLILGIFALYTIIEDGGKSWNTVLLIFTTICFLLFSYQLVRSDLIFLDANGILWKSIRKNWQRNWIEISYFTLVMIRWQEFCGYVLVDEKATTLERLARGTMGAHGMFDGGWELSAGELIALMSEAKDYWYLEICDAPNKQEE